MDTRFYVYLHTFPNGTCYVGKGTGARAKVLRPYNQHWTSLYNKYGRPNITYLATALPEDLAFLCEQEAIAAYTERGVRLCNLTEGGEGISGYAYTEEQLKALSLRRAEYMQRPEVRKKYAEYGRVHMNRPEVKQRMRQQLADRMKAPEYRQRLSERSKEISSRPEVLAARAEIMRRNWANPETREKMEGATKAYWASPDARQAQSERRKEYMNRPEVRAKNSENRKKFLAENGATWAKTEQFEFHSPSYGTFIGSRQDFLSTFPQVQASPLSALLHGRRKSVKGWVLIKKVG